MATHVNLVDEITQSLESDKHDDLIALDVSKAFDKRSHGILIHKLCRYGIYGKINAWIKKIITDRQQAVVVKGERTDLIAVESSVSQGSVLGPLLFMMFINYFQTEPICTSRPFGHDTACHNRVTIPSDQNDLQCDRLTSCEQPDPVRLRRHEVNVLIFLARRFSNYRHHWKRHN